MPLVSVPTLNVAAARERARARKREKENQRERTLARESARRKERDGRTAQKRGGHAHADKRESGEGGWEGGCVRGVGEWRRERLEGERKGGKGGWGEGRPSIQAILTIYPGHRKNHAPSSSAGHV